MASTCLISLSVLTVPPAMFANHVSCVKDRGHGTGPADGPYFVNQYELAGKLGTGDVTTRRQRAQKDEAFRRQSLVQDMKFVSCLTVSSSHILL